MSIEMRIMEDDQAQASCGVVFCFVLFLIIP